VVLAIASRRKELMTNWMKYQPVSAT
jgi:hypothetical protein